MHIIFIDADACPVKDEIYRVACRYSMKVEVVANSTMWVPANPLFTMVVRPGFGTADDWIAENTGPGDLVITADIPLAARCLEKGSLVLNAKGKQFTENDIGTALGMRSLMEELRQSNLIGVGRNGLFVSPSLRTGLADLPHPALQLMVLPQRGLTSHFMGG